MNGPMLLIAAVVVGVVVFIVSRARRGFDDPTPMSNEHLLSAIAGQATWIEKMRSASIDTQRSSSVLELTRKRKDYLARLCKEVISRAASTVGQPMYPGATKALNVFAEAADYAKELEASGLAADTAAVRAVKEKLFVPGGASFPSSWES